MGADVRFMEWAFSELLEHYGPPRRPPKLDPLDELVLTILSQNTNDTNRDRAYASLKARYPDMGSLAGADVEELAEAIKVGGLSRTKSVNILAILRDLRDRRGSFDLDHLLDMDDELAYRELLSMKGVGAKTAACVMVFSLGRPFFPVDTHIHRICIRTGMVPSTTGRERTQDIMNGTVPDDWKYDGHLLMIEHGRTMCRARKPMCGSCPLSERCVKANISER
ncbi:MAG: endonuclease III [Candidatus Thermoplasmatota archaeon]|nr:endonuclease III [Candidatus Thermoplasmatota archaeon]